MNLSIFYQYTRLAKQFEVYTNLKNIDYPSTLEATYQC